MGANDQMDAGKTACVNAGTSFNMNTYRQTFARIEGSGSFVNVIKDGTQRLLSVTSAIAPGMGADAPGTLTIDGENQHRERNGAGDRRGRQRQQRPPLLSG